MSSGIFNSYDLRVAKAKELKQSIKFFSFTLVVQVEIPI